jgi:hypothetical protein
MYLRREGRRRRGVFSQKGYFSIKYSLSEDIPVQKIQSVRIFQHEILSQ